MSQHADTLEPERDAPKNRGGAWSSQSMGTRLQHGVFYCLIRLGGKPLAHVLLYIVVLWYVVLYPSVRSKCGHYLSKRFVERKGFIARTTDSFFMVMSFGKTLIDRAALGLLGPQALTVRFEDGERLIELVEEGKGVILLNSHVGCWQTALSALEHIPAKVSLVLHRSPGDLDLHYYEHQGSAPPFEIIDPKEEFLGGVLSMMEVLGEGAILGVMGDRVFGEDRNVVSVDFLGTPADFPLTPYVLASNTGSPIVVLFSHKTGRNSYELRLAEVIRVPSGLARRPAELVAYVREFIASLERFVMAHPWQYFNFYDLWNPKSRAPRSDRSLANQDTANQRYGRSL